MAGQADGDRTGPAVRCVACGQVPATVTAVWPAWRAARYLSHMHADVRTPAAWHLAQIGAAAPHLGPGACRALLELTTGVKGWAGPAVARNPIGLVRWRAPSAAVALIRATVASPAQVRPDPGPGRPDQAGAAPCSSAACTTRRCARKKPSPCAAPTSSSRAAEAARSSSPPPARALAAPGPNTGNSHEPAGLKHRPDGAIHVVPIPPVLVSMLCRHRGDHGITPDGRLFRGARDGMLSEPIYGRAWHAALSLWLNASGTPAEIAARAGNSTRVLHEVYLHCTDGQEDTVSQRIESALDASTGSTPSSPHAKASGYTNRRHHPRPCPLSVRAPAPGPVHSPRPPGPPGPQHRMHTAAITSVSAAQIASDAI